MGVLVLAAALLALTFPNALQQIRPTVINYLFGGNDIAGTIGTAAAVGETLPPELTGNTDGVNNTWNTYVHLSTKVDGEGHAAVDAKKTFIGQLYAGGNGDYAYGAVTDGDSITHNIYLKEGDPTPIAGPAVITLCLWGVGGGKRVEPLSRPLSC